MTDKTPIQRILEDIEARELTFAGVIGIDRETGQLKVITYDHRGLVDSISEGDNAIELYGKAHVNTGAMRPIFSLSTPAGRVKQEEKK